MPCNSHSAVIVEMMITLAPRMKPHSRIKVTIRMTYGFHHVSSLIALVMLRCGGLDIHLPQTKNLTHENSRSPSILQFHYKGHITAYARRRAYACTTPATSRTRR
jgi:hypothetical protein